MAYVEEIEELLHTGIMVKRKVASAKGRSSSGRKKTGFIRKFKQLRLHHRLFFYLLGTLGVIFIWRGIWMLIDITPVFSDPFVSVFVGVGLAAIGGLFFELS